MSEVIIVELCLEILKLWSLGMNGAFDYWITLEPIDIAGIC